MIPASSMRCASRSPAARATRRRRITASPRSRPPARSRSTTAAGARPICSRSWRTPTRRARCATRSSSNARWRRLPDLPATTPVRDFATAAVVGAGTMGGGIAMSFADYGLPVKIMDVTPEALDRGMQRIRDNYATSVRRGSLAEDEMQRRLARIEPVAGYDDITDCDLVIEAVFEEMDVKKPVFAKLDEVMKPGALLFSNTSALDVDQLATMTRRPQDVAGTHFFSPANVMKLLEVVRGKASSPQTLADGDADGPPDRQAVGDGRQHRWFRRQPFARAVQHRDGDPARGRLPARAGGQGDGGFRLSDGAVRGGRSCRPRCRLPPAAGAAPRPNPNYPQAADRRSSGGDWGAMARRPAPAGTATRRATARRIPIPRLPPSSSRSPPRSARRSRSSPTRRSCTGCCSRR